MRAKLKKNLYDWRMGVVYHAEPYFDAYNRKERVRVYFPKSTLSVIVDWDDIEVVDEDERMTLKELDERLYEERKRIELLIENYNEKVGEMNSNAFVLGVNTLDLKAKYLDYN